MLFSFISKSCALDENCSPNPTRTIYLTLSLSLSIFEMHSTHNTWCIRAEFANRDFTLNKSRPQWGKTTQPTSETEIDETDRVRKSESLFIGIHDKILCIHSRTQYPVFYLMLLFDALHGDHEICHHSNFSCGIMRKQYTLLCLVCTTLSHPWIGNLSADVLDGRFSRSFLSAAAPDNIMP